MTGYLHPNYAESFSEFGKPHPLPRCGGHLLVRQVPNPDCVDAMGCYPLFCCQDWTRLREDLEALGHQMVSVALVADPFGNHDEPLLRGCFDRVVKFKEHFIADLSRPLEQVISKHHRYYARQALKKVQVEVAAAPLDFLEEWVGLYRQLIERHGIGGFRAFSRDSFARQLAVPGMTLVRATLNGTSVAMHLYYGHGDVHYSHLAACSPEGYAVNAMYAVYLRSLEHFIGKARWLNWGGSAGVTHDGTDGLAQFKRGWSIAVRQVYFCGLTLDPARYETLTRERGGPATDYFPAYRRGEF